MANGEFAVISQTLTSFFLSWVSSVCPGSNPVAPTIFFSFLAEGLELVARQDIKRRNKDVYGNVVD